MSDPSTPRLADLVDAIEGLYPPALAQSWDRSGLAVGDPAAPVRRVLLAVDPTLAVVREARERGADLLLTHHPLLLRGVSYLPTTTSKGATVTALLAQGTALYCAHTSADSADPGVSHALADVVGLLDTEPLTHEEGKPLGRVGRLPAPTTLAALADLLAGALPTGPAGIRYAGDPHRPVERVAVAGGSGDGAFDAARASGADAYVTADLRHHPALEDLETTAVTGGPALVDAGHYASEWPWLPVAAHRLGEALAARGTKVEIDISTQCTDPWAGVALSRP